MATMREENERPVYIDACGNEKPLKHLAVVSNDPVAAVVVLPVDAYHRLIRLSMTTVMNNLAAPAMILGELIDDVRQCINSTNPMLHAAKVTQSFIDNYEFYAELTALSIKLRQIERDAVI